MKFKSIVPYLIFGAATLGAPAGARAQTQNGTAVDNNKLMAMATQTATTFDKNFSTLYDANYCLELKARDVCYVYIDNMLAAQQKLNPLIGKRGYLAAVRRELPGAPAGMHCVYGQYTQLQRALDEMGDTITVIPQGAQRACNAFKVSMRKKYSAQNGYENCIFEGNVFESDSAYEAALEKYLAARGVTIKTPMDIWAKHATEFAKHNWSIESVSPGTMLVVPRTRGSKTKFHMIMLLGRGRIEKGEFIPDDKGEWVCTGHNNERIWYLFDTWDTRNVFAANTKKIIRTEYERELNKIDEMSIEELIQFLIFGNMVTAAQLRGLPRSVLRKMARDKYLEKYIPFQPNLQQIAQNLHTPTNTLLAGSRQNTI